MSRAGTASWPRRVTDDIVIPWLLDGLAFDAPVEKKKDSLKRYADIHIHIHSGWQD